MYVFYIGDSEVIGCATFTTVRNGARIATTIFSVQLSFDRQLLPT